MKTKVSYLSLFATVFGLAGSIFSASAQTNTAKADDLSVINLLSPNKDGKQVIYPSQNVQVVVTTPQWFYANPSLTKTMNFGTNHDMNTLYKFAYYGNQKVAYTESGWIAADNLSIVSEFTNMNKYQELLKQPAPQLKPSSKITKKYYTEFVKGNMGRIVIKRNGVRMYKHANANSKQVKHLKKGTRLYVSDLVHNNHGWFFAVFNSNGDGNDGYVSSNKSQIYFSGKSVKTPGM